MKINILTFCLLAFGCLAGPVFGQADPVYEKMFSFNDARTEISPDNPVAGAEPNCELIQGRDGNFYGTTKLGGANGKGTIFRMTPSGDLTTLVNFTGSNGSEPIGGLIQGVDGNYYGTTSTGGANGHGTVFTMTPNGILETLVNFNGTDGSAPMAGLAQVAGGAFYGTTSAGGTDNKGTIFKMLRSGSIKTLVNFTGTGPAAQDNLGAAPMSRLVISTDGTYLCGTTSAGGVDNAAKPNGHGTVFMMEPDASLVTTLVNFTGTGFPFKGSAPLAGLVQGASNVFYGTTSTGGANNCGTVFKISISGSSLQTFNTLVDFTGGVGQKQGRAPMADLVRGHDGFFYGSTYSGSESDNGTIFKISSAGTGFKTLVKFTFNGISNKGAFPAAGLLQGSDGNFYGTTTQGCAPNKGSVFKMTTAGAFTTMVQFAEIGGLSAGILPTADMVRGEDGCFYGTTSGGAFDKGTIFKISPQGTLTTLYTFTVGGVFRAGNTPNALVFNAIDGCLYGTTSAGGRSNNNGTFFKLTPPAEGTEWVLDSLYSFTGAGGSAPLGSLVQVGADFYGTTSAGGANDCGTVFRIKTDGTAANTKLERLADFTGDGPTNKGRAPLAGLCLNKVGTHLYGTTSAGGRFDQGTIFRIPVAGGAGRNVTTLVNFIGGNSNNPDESNGSMPKAALVLDSDGSHFYGTTFSGGKDGHGTVFMMTPEGGLTTLVEFTGNGQTNGGSGPSASLLQSNNAFYGTTTTGGASDCGTIFKFTGTSPTTLVETLVEFTDNGVINKGSGPFSSLTKGDNEVVYGTTSSGGAFNVGTVFKMTTVGNPTLTTLAEFAGDGTINKGSGPVAGLTEGADGIFYGTTLFGGASGYGTVFMVTAGGTLTTLVEFTGNGTSNKGRLPKGDLVKDSDGNFYGTTFAGGTFDSGTVFKMTKSGALTTLVEFTGQGQTNRGGNPAVGLVLGSDGNFYGTTQRGGAVGSNNGTVFKMTPNGTLTTLVEFTGRNGLALGSAPHANLLAVGDDFYGTTSAGGQPDKGTIFKMTSTGILTTLVEFTGSTGLTLGGSPFGGLVKVGGDFYGTTSTGGSGKFGTVFKLVSDGTPAGKTLETLLEFSGEGTTNKGSDPQAALVVGGDGNFYGTTRAGGSIRPGGTINKGTVFKLPVGGNLTSMLVNFMARDEEEISHEGSPTARLIAASDGNLYGTASGPDGCIYRLIFPGKPILADARHTALDGSNEILEVRVNPRGDDTQVILEFGTNPLLKDAVEATVFPNKKTVALNINGYQTKMVGTTLANLQRGTIYYYRFKAVSIKGTTTSKVFSFTSLAPPSIELGATTNINSKGLTANMQFNDTVQSSQFPATVYWEWGTDGFSFPNITPTVIAQASDSPVPVNFALLGLVKGEIYYYRLVADNTVYDASGKISSGGRTVSGVGSFTTPIECIAKIIDARRLPDAPVVELSGTVNARGFDTDVSFQYTDSPNADFLPILADLPIPTPATGFKETPVSVKVSLNNLNQNQTYYYRISGKSDGGNVLSSVGTFSVAGISGLLQSPPNARPGPLFSISVTTNGSEVAGGWRFDGERDWRPTGFNKPVNGLEQSNRIIEFMPVNGYVTPSSIPIEISNSAPETYNRVYTNKGQTGSGTLRVTLLPAGTGQWRLFKPGVGPDDNVGTWRSSGSLKLLPGTYIVECRPTATHITPPQRSVVIANGQTKRVTFNYVLKTPVSGLAPTVVETNSDLPHAYVGQILSDSGSGSGFVVKPRVVVTAGHVVFDSETLSYVTGLKWLFQRDSSNYEPRPLMPRGAHLMDNYSAARKAANQDNVEFGEGTPTTQNRDAAALFFNEDAGRGGYAGYLASDQPYNEFLNSTALKILAGYPTSGDDIIPGRLYATPKVNAALTPTFGTDDFDNPLRIYRTSAVRGSGGMSGGPLFVQYKGGEYYPAGIYVGGDNEVVVRAIDSEVTELITLADASSTTGNNNTNAGIVNYSHSSADNIVSTLGGIKVFMKTGGASNTNRWKYILHFKDPVTGQVTNAPSSSFIPNDPNDPNDAPTLLQPTSNSISYTLVYTTSTGDESRDLDAEIKAGEILEINYTKTPPNSANGAPAIAVEQPVGTNLASGVSKSFGNVSVGSVKNFTFTIKNKGNAELTGLSITKDGTNPGDFIVTGPLQSRITGPSGVTTFKVAFKPVDAGLRSAVIHIASNDSNKSPFNIRLTGTGTGPEISISQPASVNISDGGSKSFGGVTVGSNKSLTFTIKNTGSANLTGLAITKDGANASNFTITRKPGAPVTAGKSTTFIAKFTPSSAGSKTAKIHIASNDKSEDPFDITLTGSGIAAAPLPKFADGVLSSSGFFSAAALPNLADESVIQNDQKSVTTVELVDGLKYQALTITKSPGDLYLRRAVEVSPNLLDWYSGMKHTTIMQDDDTLFKVRDNTPITPGIKRYIRLREAGN